MNRAISWTLEGINAHDFYLDKVFSAVDEEDFADAH